MMSKTHNLKTWPTAFDAQAYGEKNFEFRRNDRDFAVGDILILSYYDPILPSWRQPLKPKTVTRIVTYILHGGCHEVPVGYCVMSTKPMEG